MPISLSSRGLLIVFEGIDGAGKTTQARALARSLRAQGFDVVESKEPTNGPWGQKLRESASTGRMGPEEELSLFLQDRREHVRDLVEPALAAGKVVILDRYYFSTAAYQGARGMDFEQILQDNEAFAPQPDLLFILQVAPSVGRSRIAKRGDQANHFEGEAELAASARIFDLINRPCVRRLDGAKSIHELEHIVNYAVSIATEARTPRHHIHVPGLTAESLLQAARALQDDESVPDEGKAEALLVRVGVNAARS